MAMNDTGTNGGNIDDGIEGDNGLEALEDRIRPRLVSNLLLWVILGFCVVALIWAALARVDRSVQGMGRVVPSSKLQVVSNLEGGIVEAILAKAGDHVAAGAPLLRLDQTLSAAELGSSSATVAALAARVERLRAETSGGVPNFSVGAAANDQSQIETERVLYRARMSELAGLSNAASARALEARRAVDEARAVLASRQAAAQAAETQLGQIRPLVERGIEPQMTLVQAQSAAASSRADASAAAAALQRAQANVATALSTRQEQIASWHARAGSELDTAQAELSARQRTLPALADRVRRTTITAPIAGRVNRVLVTTLGGSVTPGSPLVEIVPSDEALVIETLLNPKDIATVKIGQKAKVSITAYDSSIYGSLEGTVIGVSPDATVNERTGESHFTVRVRTSSSALMAHGGRRLPIGPGMLADVSLLGDSQSVLSYILSPITKLSDSAFRE